MINKKLKTLIATVIITSLSSNVAFAEIIKLQAPTISTNSNSSTGNKIDIVKDQASTSVVTLSEINQKKEPTGNEYNGNLGVTIAAAYLTPDKKFGYMYVDKYDYKNGGGTVIAAIDELNPNNKWGGNVNSGTSTSNNRLFLNASKYFTNSSGPIVDKITNLDDTKLDSYIIQTADDGRKFVAATLYVRYTYDFLDKHDWGGYLQSYPVLGNTNAYTNGPYIGMGDYFDFTIDVIQKGNKGRDDIAKAYGKYFVELSSVANSDLGFNRLGLMYDYNPVSAGSGSYVKTNTNKAMLEKRFEYRRYITTKQQTITNPGGYEVVYPVTNTTVKTQSTLPDIAPKASIKSTTEYTDSNRTQVNRYRFDIAISTRKKDNYYAKDLETYTVRKVSDRPTNEPSENEMDFWHSDVEVYLDVVDSSGNSKLYNKKKINATDTLVYINLDEVKPDTSGNRSLDRCTAKLLVNFKNNSRFMVSKQIYSYFYKLDGADKTYNQVIEYIDKKPTGLQLKTEITKYEESTDPREVLTYKTQTSSAQSIEASCGISAITAGDYANTMVSVDVNPPHTLTVLEGATFEAIVNIDTNGIPIGYTGVDMWISDFKIDSLTITAANGDLVYKETNVPISPSPPSSRVTQKFSNLTAKPTHIGVATVLVNYSYNINVQRYSWEVVEYTDKDGNIKWRHEKVAEPVEVTPQFGSATNYFNIHSVSANTVH